MKTLSEIVNEKPFADYAEWWPMGSSFTAFMSEAIVTEWNNVMADKRDSQDALAKVEQYVTQYLDTVFKRRAKTDLVTDFVYSPTEIALSSGEFDALSYGFYRSSFETLSEHTDDSEAPLEQERRCFTKAVGKIFFQRIHDYLQFDLPSKLETKEHFACLKQAITSVGDFLQEQGYLRDHFAFDFNVKAEHSGDVIKQSEADAMNALKSDSTTYALFEMGYPVILPSAVYLYHTLGEAQHHSSRTIEELFSLAGYEASEVDDFDPIDYPSDKVVELWEIRQDKALNTRISVS